MNNASADPARAVLSHCSHVLLDMHGTFMFSHDRLGAIENFGATYRRLGGAMMSHGEVSAAILDCVAHMTRLYEDPGHEDAFPSVMEVLRGLPAGRFLSEPERERLVSVIAHHESGRVPVQHAEAVRALAKTHRLALVSNIWSPKALWLDELDRAGLTNAFSAMVFSSDTSSVKPSPTLFRNALRDLGLNERHASECVCVGDSLRCDVRGAQRVGMNTIWINGQSEAVVGAAPDGVVGDLVALVRGESG